MERLQAAIEKARAQREATGRGDMRSDRGPDPAPRDRERDREHEHERGRGRGAVAEAWAALAPLAPSPGLDRKRVVSHTGGRDAAPYDMLRTRMLQQARKHGWRRVALVSPHSGSGKTTTAANLIHSFGRQGDLRTIVLDLDLRRVGLSKLMAQKPRHGMDDVLQGRVSFAEHGLRAGANVVVGLNRGPASNPSELLQSRATAEAIDEIDRAYKPDVMIFDMPAMLATDETYGFLRHVDCALMLAAAEQTSMDVIDVSEREIAELTDVMGIVLNKCRYTEGAYGYENGYY